MVTVKSADITEFIAELNKQEVTTAGDWETPLCPTIGTTSFPNKTPAFHADEIWYIG